jgi:hypothetical protein
MRLLALLTILVAAGACNGTEPQPAPLTYAFSATYEAAAQCSCCNQGTVCDTTAISMSATGVIHFTRADLNPPATMTSSEFPGLMSTRAMYSSRIGDSVDFLLCELSACTANLRLAGRVSGDSIFGRSERFVPGGSNSSSRWGRFVARRNP